MKRSKQDCENADKFHIIVDVKCVCVNGGKVFHLRKDELHILSQKISFRYLSKSRAKIISVDIPSVSIISLQYSEDSNVIRVQSNRNLHNHKEMDYTSIWFCINVKDYEEYMSIINRLTNFDTIKVNPMSIAVVAEFRLLMLKLKPNEKDILLLEKCIFNFPNIPEKSVEISAIELLGAHLPEIKSHQNGTKSELSELPETETSSNHHSDHSDHSDDLKKSLKLPDVIKAHSNKGTKSKKKRKAEILDDEVIVKPLKKRRLSCRINCKLLYSPAPNSSIEITPSDLDCLRRGEYLNDNIINLYLTYIFHDILTESQRDVTYFFNVFFNTKLIGTKSQEKIDTPESRHARVAKWTKNVDIFAKDFIFIPVVENDHWFLVVVCFPWMAGIVNYSDIYGKGKIEEIPANKTIFATKTRLEKVAEIKKRTKVRPMPCILILDSLRINNTPKKVNIIRDYLRSEWDAKRKVRDGPLIFDKTTCRGYIPNVPEQDNGTDCGLFLLQYVESFFRKPVSNYDKDSLKKDLLDWFDSDEVTENKRDEIKHVIKKKTTVIYPDDNDDDDSSFSLI